MSLRLKKIATSPSFRCFVLSKNTSVFTALTNRSLLFIWRSNAFKCTQVSRLYVNYTRLFTRGFAIDAKFECATGDVDRPSDKGKDEWDVEKLPEEDRFGTLSSDGYELKTFDEVYEVTKEDKKEAGDVEHVHRGRKNSPIWYANQMKTLLKEGKLREALDVLEVRMLKEDRVQPTEYNYDILIGGCGRAGYTKKAFHLYNDMKKRGLNPSAVTYTALFNACSESPWPETDGITRLKKLHGQLLEKEIRINLITHHAMMKAYAKCGDIQMAFKLFHHLLESGVELTAHSFVFLFFACASQKDSGFVLAIEGWRHMLLKGIKPNNIIYNLLLRIVRDCGIGDLEKANQVLLNSPTLKQKMIAGGSSMKQQTKRNKSKKPEQLEVTRLADERTINVFEDLNLLAQETSVKDGRVPTHSDNRKRDPDSWERGLENQDLFLLNSSEKSVVSQTGTGSSNDLASVSTKKTDTHPKMLSLNPNLEGIMSLTAMETPAERLSLLGGTRGILESMTSNDLKPDCRTLTLLAEIIPKKTSAETELLKVVDDLDVKVDVDFYNMLIRKRTKRNYLTGAKALLADIKRKGLYPSMRTFVALASGCTQQKDGLQLLADVKDSGITPTQPLYNALISAAHSQRNYEYVTDILKDMERTKVWPNQRTITQLEKVAEFQAKHHRVNPKLNGFRGFYTTWLNRIGYQGEKHPWNSYYSKPIKYDE
ncbi:pentatricopeptide repeat-containing protein 1, mitochondrial-like [Anneissia japonica]|uniref:pentatricopeptide repeat-containing protein 1, mitochondrial-like n=1 Tax=Anneissia japonica TaxID=1529436 RepID=UPI0014258FB9|nr:pentatricopeptide repeat-containing protein 1, mitochondrial-like [Anneissia japonica]